MEGKSIYNIMPQKTIALPERVYRSLSKLKRKEETYSDVIQRLMEESQGKKNHPDIAMYYGKLEEEDSGEWDKIEEEIYQNRIKKSVPKRKILGE